MQRDMSSSCSRRRIIACVDGTWYDADGSEGKWDLRQPQLLAD